MQRHKIPTNKELYTSFVISARPMAINGGINAQTEKVVSCEKGKRGFLYAHFKKKGMVHIVFCTDAHGDLFFDNKEYQNAYIIRI